MEETGDRPKWLLELENRKRKPRLAHEVGAGSPCTKCTSSCPGLDLHFWRKICKNCKCSRDDHDVPDTEFPQFDLLFGPSGPPKRRCIILKRKSNEETFEWAPPDTTQELAADYMKALPEEKLPIKGTAGALFRKQQLQKQLPLHDIDHKVCDELSDSERKQFEKYLENLKNFVGQGRVSKFVTARPFDRSLMTPANASECFSPKHRPTISSNSPNLRTPSSFVQKKYEKSPECPMASAKREVLQSSGIVQSNEGAKLGRYHYAVANVKSEGEVAEAERVPGVKNSGVYFGNLSALNEEKKSAFNEENESALNKIGTGALNKIGESALNKIGTSALYNEEGKSALNKIGESALNKIGESALNKIGTSALYNDKGTSALNKIGKTALFNENYTSALNENPKSALFSDNYTSALNKEFNPINSLSDSSKIPNSGLHFAQSNLHDFPYQAHLEKSGKADVAVCDQGPLRTHQWAKSLRPSGQLGAEDNSVLAEKMLNEALLPPSAVHASDIIGSTLDEKGLSYIRERLASKYGDREEGSDCHAGRGKEFHGEEGKSVNARPVPSQLKAFGANSGLVHSETLHNPAFPEEAVLRAMGHSTIIDRLGPDFENMSLQSPKQNCHQCKEDIVLGDVIVTAERAKDAAWHPGCFVCSVCDELLVDLVYFYHKGKLYCGRDFAGLLEIPRCHACDELIFVREYTVAEGHNYHVKHFCCWDCDIPLAGQQYISESDRPLCLPCYQKTYAKTCSACNKVIAADQQGVAVKNLDFHASDECFCCANCRKSLLNGRMAIKENKPFCSKECITTFLNKVKN